VIKPMQDMTIEARGRIRVHSRGIGTVASYALLGFAFYILMMAFINNPMDSYGASFALALIPVALLVLFAAYVVQEVVVDTQGVTRIGLLGRRTTILWEQIQRIQLVRNTAGLREMVIYGKKKKIVLSNTIFLIEKPNFWEAAFVLLDRADAAGRPVKAGFILGRRAWFYYGSTYLPGDKFEDREASLEGPKSEK
jgi:hypothetical protein